MLKRTLLGNVVSDEGFRLKLRVGGGEIEYQEENRHVVVYADEDINGVIGFLVPKDARWQGAGGERCLSAEEARLVTRRIGEALRFLGLEFRVNSPRP